MSSKRVAMAVSTAVILLAAFGRGNARPLRRYQATGIKIGEVTDSSAIIWTRLTQRAERVGPEAPMPKVSYHDPTTGELSERRGSGRPDRVPVVEFPNGSTIETIEGAVPGMPGQVRLLYEAEGAPDRWATSWHSVDPSRDYTYQFTLRRLRPNTKYRVRVVPWGDSTSVIDGVFRTAPSPDESER